MSKKHHTKKKHYPKKSKKSYKYSKKKYFKKPKSNKKANKIKIRTVITPILFIAATVTSILKYLLKSYYLINISATFWFLFMLSFYTNLLRYINRLDLRDDLTLWGLRIIGIVVVGIGVFFGSFLISYGVIFGKPFLLGGGILLFGLVIPGAFALFRSVRRYPIVHVDFLK